MTDKVIERALRIAMERHRWNQAEFALRVGADKQHVTNWKKRGLPPARYVDVAKVLGISVDELLGDAASISKAQRILAPTVMAHDEKLTESAVLFASEWAKLPPALQAQVQALVYSMVSELGLNERPKRHRKKLPDGRPTA